VHLTPDTASFARFRADLESITGRSPGADAKLGIAVSGGPDSAALLLLAAAAWPGAVEAATVDHGLRPEAADEAAFVGELCARLGVPHAILTPPGNLIVEGNLQEQARGMRYVLLGLWAGSGTLLNARPWRVEWVATAHQRDDVAEGLLMRARRGAGVGGLAAMRSSRPIGPMSESPALIRPLLGWSRNELAGIVADAGIEPVADPSNSHPRFDRARMRALLAQNPELPAGRLAMAAANLRHAEDALAWLAEREWAARSEVEDYETVWFDPTGLPYEIRRRLALRAVDAIRFEFNVPGTWRQTGIDRLLAALDSGKPGTIAEVQARPISGRWRFTLAPARRSH
jgi:tRNA(Ile)-lysidine synthase